MILCSGDQSNIQNRYLDQMLTTAVNLLDEKQALFECNSLRAKSNVQICGEQECLLNCSSELWVLISYIQNLFFRNLPFNRNFKRNLKKGEGSRAYCLQLHFCYASEKIVNCAVDFLYSD